MIVDETVFRTNTDDALVAWTAADSLRVGARRATAGKILAIAPTSVVVSFTSGTGQHVSDPYTGREGSISDNWDLVNEVDIRWGDGGSDLIVAPYASQMVHAYAAAGIYQVTLIVSFVLPVGADILYQQPAAVLEKLMIVS